MIPRLSPAELRTAVRLMDIYTEAKAQILAEEEAAEVSARPSADAMVAARIAEITATEEGLAAFVAYLRGLMETHGADPDMAGHAGLALASLSDPVCPTPAHTPTTPHAARLDRSPQVAAATEGDPS